MSENNTDYMLAQLLVEQRRAATALESIVKVLDEIATTIWNRESD